ncbi:uncharacterized protein LOC134458289 isoform X2 [Engraulis encrasicolus]|uniref:uncharacterized protein LOC134437925 isoform X2 n=1 Tax=Engraulis encrasicolus TaxID=184585 RepID=UPI002FCEE1BC
MQSWEPPQQPQRPAKSRMITRLPHSEISGTSMGSKMAPSFASLYCGLFEQQHIWDECNPHLQHITNWKRYIDDVFFIWQAASDGSAAKTRTFRRKPRTWRPGSETDSTSLSGSQALGGASTVSLWAGLHWKNNQELENQDS